MQIDDDLISKQVSFHVGDYYPPRSKEPTSFSVSLDARQLVALIQDSLNGARVYEFLSIKRPADILNYVWVEFGRLSDPLKSKLQADLKNPYEHLAAELTGANFIPFSNSFTWQFEDTPRENVLWLDFVNSDLYRDYVKQIYRFVLKYQSQLKLVSDPLLQHELSLIDNQIHTLDYAVCVNRYHTKETYFSSDPNHSLITEFASFLSILIQDADIKSVSCPYDGYPLWRILVKEQVKRAQQTGLTPQNAFALYGPDREWNYLTTPDYWGGYVHLPLEGMCKGDLVFFPNWRKFHPEFAGKNGSLAEATNLGCKHLFVLKEHAFGDIDCATRQDIGDWVYYKSRDEN